VDILSEQYLFSQASYRYWLDNIDIEWVYFSIKSIFLMKEWYELLNINILVGWSQHDTMFDILICLSQVQQNLDQFIL
jgi:hypothetical protein